MLSWHLAPVIVAAAAATANPSAGQAASVRRAISIPAVIPGVVAENVVSAADSTQRYAVYLPREYRTDRRWPLLVLMDPRGRALVPMNLIREAAERLGYLVISSYNTMSDGPIDPNGAALTAILTDAQHQLAIDPHRLYLVGFSGTARSAWLFAYAMRGYVAGIIGVGAGLPPGFTPPERVPGDGPPPAFFGIVGTTDYNFDEVRRLETTLPGSGFPYRVTYHDGPHSWPPAGHLAAAVEWLQLQAMIRGLTPVDSAWVDRTYAARLDRAEQSLAAGSAYEAYREVEAVARDFAPVHPVETALNRARALRETREVQRTIRQLDEMTPGQWTYIERLARFLLEFRKAETPPPLARMLDKLQIAELQRRAAQTEDTVDALAARRCLAHVMVYTSFYEPREFFERGEPARALALLEIARTVQPGSPSVCYQQARALASLQRPEEAVAALECMVERTHPRRTQLAQDPDLAPLRGHPAFDRLLAGLSDGTAP